jgi:hypothetical protein
MKSDKEDHMPQTMNPQLANQTEAEALQEIRKIADFLDTKYTLPFGWKIGWDGILGLIPGIGDVTTTLISFYILYKAAILGCPLVVVLRMALNILIDNIIDTIPILGNIFDFMWKANSKNLALLEAYHLQPHQTRRSSQAVVALTLILTALAIIGVGVLTFYIARWMWGVFQTAW